MNTATAIEYDVLRHGAVGDGKTLNTECLQGVIDELHAHGGGQAYFPAGRYLTGSLQLKSGVTLYLERGAVLLGSTSPYDYPHVEPQSDLKVNDDHFNQALIYADGAERIGIGNWLWRLTACIIPENWLTRIIIPTASVPIHARNWFTCAGVRTWTSGISGQGAVRHGGFRSNSVPALRWTAFGWRTGLIGITTESISAIARMCAFRIA